MPILRTIAHEATVEIPPIKGSRFIGRASRVRTVDEARAFLQSVRDAWPKATHHVSAWRIDPQTTAANDDGEPAGTSGRPLLDRLVGHELVQTVIVVTRFFGGTKLGKGGLVRAYGAAASAVLDAAGVKEEVATAAVEVTCAHPLVGPLHGVIAAHGGTVTNQRWGQQATFTALVPTEHADACRAALIDRAAGNVHIG